MGRLSDWAGPFKHWAKKEKNLKKKKEKDPGKIKSSQ